MTASQGKGEEIRCRNRCTARPKGVPHSHALVCGLCLQKGQRQSCQPSLLAGTHTHHSLSQGRTGHPLHRDPDLSRSQEVGRAGIRGQRVLLQLRTWEPALWGGGKEGTLDAVPHPFGHVHQQKSTHSGWARSHSPTWQVPPCRIQAGTPGHGLSAGEEETTF